MELKKKYKILLKEKVISEDVPKLSKNIKLRIQKTIQQKISTLPELFGKPLRTPLHHFKKIRVGNYRIVFKIERDNKCVILGIRHRKDIYLELEKRI